MCRVCNTVFTVEGSRKSSAKYCSFACRGKGVRFELAGRGLSALSNLTAVEAAYIAGIIDGEGHIVIQANKRPVAFIGITNTSPELMLWLQQRLPESRTYRSSDCHPRPRRKPCWELRVARPLALKPLLEQVLPHMVVKRAKALEVIDLITARYSSRSG